MDDTPRKIPIVFYQTPAGADVVLDWLRELDAEADLKLARKRLNEFE